MPSEITWLLKTLGYATIGIFGAKLGASSRKDKLTTEDFEMLAIAEKMFTIDTASATIVFRDLDNKELFRTTVQR